MSFNIGAGSSNSSSDQRNILPLSSLVRAALLGTPLPVPAQPNQIGHGDGDPPVEDEHAPSVPIPYLPTIDERLLIKKYWSLANTMENMSQTIRDRPLETPGGLLVPSYLAEFKEEATQKLEQLTQYEPTSFAPDKTRVALAVSKTIGAVSVLAEALEPVMIQRPEIRGQIDELLEFVNSIVTTKATGAHPYNKRHFKDSVSRENKRKLQKVVTDSMRMRSDIRSYFNRSVDAFRTLRESQHDARKALERTDFRL